MLVTVASLRSSPGVTTATVGYAQAAAANGWDDVLLVEADPDGAVHRWLLPHLDPDRNLLTFGVAARRGAAADILPDHTQPLFNGYPQPQALIAPDVGPQVARALDMSADVLVDHAAADNRLVIVDCGRLSNVAATIFHRGDRRLLLFGAHAPDVLSTKALLDTHPDVADDLDLVLVGDQPYGPDDVTSIGLELAGHLPHDPKGARAIVGLESMPEKRYAKTPLVKAIAGLVPDAPRGPAVAALDAGPDTEPATATSSGPTRFSDDDLEELSA